MSEFEKLCILLGIHYTTYTYYNYERMETLPTLKDCFKMYREYSHSGKEYTPWGKHSSWGVLRLCVKFHIRVVKRVFSSDKIISLEEMIWDKLESSSFDIYKRVQVDSVYYFNNFKNVSEMYNTREVPSTWFKSRSEALANLTTQINWTDEERNKIKEIIIKS